MKKVEDKIIVGTTAFRTNYEQVKPAIEVYKSETDLSIPSLSLTELQIQNIHEAAKRRIVSEFTQNFAPTPQLIFEHKYGFVVRAFHYHPVLLRCDKIEHKIQLDYMPIDYLLLNQILKDDVPYENQISICDNAADMAMMELSNKDVEKNFDFKSELNEQELLVSVQRMMKSAPNVFSTPLNQYLSSIRHFICSENLHFDAISIEDQDFFLKLSGN